MVDPAPSFKEEVAGKLSEEVTAAPGDIAPDIRSYLSEDQQKIIIGKDMDLDVKVLQERLNILKLARDMLKK